MIVREAFDIGGEFGIELMLYQGKVLAAAPNARRRTLETGLDGQVEVEDDVGVTQARPR